MSSPLLQLPHTYRAFYGAFSHLYSIQRQCIKPMLDGKDLIVQSATGSGKTEAVLAPCLERVIQSNRTEAVLYIVPTRALAIDIERRLGSIFTDRLGLHLRIRTGDVKRTGGERPDLMLTTPESLDVALGSANADMRAFMQRVRTVIIDEVHPLVHTYRGTQLAYLLHRLEQRIGRHLQKVALSATIADVDAIIRFFHFHQDTVRLIESVHRDIVPHLIHIDREETEFPALLDDLYDRWHYRKILVFANSRGRCDRLMALTTLSERFRGVADLHYSNLKPRTRRTVEHQFRNRNQALCIATSTLELGIDIGDVDGVVLYEPPDSVSAFLQRSGRANRRQTQTHIWGVCRGEQAGLQLLRFLGLLRLARRSELDMKHPMRLPSVLIQQILSCLYEKRRLSLPALKTLFPDDHAAIAACFETMLARRWLREDAIKGLVRGGKHYRDCFLERRIWSNFPEAEDDYSLELTGEAIADIPTSVVRQLEPGDRVLLTGKRMQILQIDTGDRKHVTASPVQQLDDKDILWLGTGFQVSWEIAHAMKEALLSSEEIMDGLFVRTRRLFQTAQARMKGVVQLANGIEVNRTAQGLYRYYTFLGSLGNLILQWAIEQTSVQQEESRIITFDEIGLDSSHLIVFETLPLPVDYDSFQRWTATHLKALKPLFPLNAFSSVLPQDLLIQEMTSFLFDPRIANTFSQFLASTSEVVSGDPSILEIETPLSIPQTPVILDTALPNESLLAWEKQRWPMDKLRIHLNLPEQHRPRTLTATMVGTYMRHQQCERWLSYTSLPPDQRPLHPVEDETSLDALRINQGNRHELQVLEELGTHHDMKVIAEEVSGQRRSLKERCEDTLAQLHTLAQAIFDANQEEWTSSPTYLAQGVLTLPEIYTHAGVSDASLGMVDGIGIPDLIRVTGQAGQMVLEVGDIKDSAEPYISQKWQVAFYAFLLTEVGHRRSLPYEVSKTGFLITRPLPGSDVPQTHSFDLHPFLAAFPALLRHIAAVLSRPPCDASYRIQPHCVACPYFSSCYPQALHMEDIQFLPQLTTGEFEKLKAEGLSTIEAAGAWMADSSNIAPFEPYQRGRLQDRLTTMQTNRIYLKERATRLYPANLSTAIFIHIIEDPVTARLRGLGLCAVDQTGALNKQQTWTVMDDTEEANALASFTDLFLNLWHAGIKDGSGPHVFHFGEPSRRTLMRRGDKHPLSFLWSSERTHHTDLRRIFMGHFNLPLPGRPTLFALARMLGLASELSPPASLFHNDETPAAYLEENTLWKQETTTALDISLALQIGLWQWLTMHLESDWIQSEWADTGNIEAVSARTYLDFLDEERRLREEDVLALQACPLPDRVARWRAIGPITYMDRALDEEGRFLYRFQMPPDIGLSKFREGDFLKLAPMGSPNIQDGYGVILHVLDRRDNLLSIRSRQGRFEVTDRLTYSLEEDLTDWTGPGLAHAVRVAFSDSRHPMVALLSGHWHPPCDPSEARWVASWLQRFGGLSGLNDMQQRALSLPFHHRVGLIEGPPGTGKTHLLAWTLIALILHADETGRPMRLVVSALTHQAIDQVLTKVVELVTRHRMAFTGRCFKWGRAVEILADETISVASLTDVNELAETRHAIVGATGFGLYQLFESGKGTFPQAFDWIVFDEASQVLVPQALLSLLYGKGGYLFYGDVHQLPPIVLGNYQTETTVHRSVLHHLQARYDESHRIRLDRTYRMNTELCAFPSQTWYDGLLHPAPENAYHRLTIHSARREDTIDQIIDPEQPVTLVMVSHRGSHQQSDIEADIMADLADRLMTKHDLQAEQLALISPHRAQNNAIAARLLQRLEDDCPLPLIDTVERIQGAERDVILYAFTTSDPDHIMDAFLNNPNRFNVAITRARKKLIVIGSQAFFSSIPQTEEALIANACFKAFVEHCRERKSLFTL